MSNFLRVTPTVSIQGPALEGGWERALVSPKDKRDNLTTSRARGRFLGKSSDSLGCEEGVTAGETRLALCGAYGQQCRSSMQPSSRERARKAADCAGPGTGWHFGPSQDSGGMIPSTELR